MVCRRLGERPTSIIGAGLVSGGCLLSTQATSVPFLCISMGLLLGELPAADGHTGTLLHTSRSSSFKPGCAPTVTGPFTATSPFL